MALQTSRNFVPAKNSTVYPTASIAKPVTAAAAMQLIEAGKLDLDVPIEKYVVSHRPSRILIWG